MSVDAVLERLQPGDHVCAPVVSTSELNTLAIPFAEGGLRDDYKVVFAVNDPPAFRHHLTARIPRAIGAFATGQIEVRSVAASYLPGGVFQPDVILETIAASIDTAQRQGYRGLRISGSLSGTRFRSVNAETLADYESRANEFCVNDQIIGMCHYNPDAFEPAAWQDVMTTHPSTILAGSDQPVTEFRCRRTDSGVRLTGEVDMANRNALLSMLAVVVRLPGPCEIDATALRFADGQAIAHLLRVAAERGERPTTIVCAGHLARLLDLFGTATAPNLTLTAADTP